MRIVAAAFVVLALAACGQSQTTAPVQAEEAAVQVVKTYAPDEFSSLNGGTVEVTAAGARITTLPREGAMSARLDLGEEALADGLVLRVRLQVERGGFGLVMTRANWPADYQHLVQYLTAGEPVTIDLPIDRTGAPLLIVSNAANDGQPSAGVIVSAQLVPGAALRESTP